MVVVLDVDRLLATVFEALFYLENRLTGLQANGFAIIIIIFLLYSTLMLPSGHCLGYSRQYCLQPALPRRSISNFSWNSAESYVADDNLL